MATRQALGVVGHFVSTWMPAKKCCCAKCVSLNAYVIYGPHKTLLGLHRVVEFCRWNGGTPSHCCLLVSNLMTMRCDRYSQCREIYFLWDLLDFPKIIINLNKHLEICSTVLNDFAAPHFPPSFAFDLGIFEGDGCYRLFILFFSNKILFINELCLNVVMNMRVSIWNKCLSV